MLRERLQKNFFYIQQTLIYELVCGHLECVCYNVEIGIKIVTNSTNLLLLHIDIQSACKANTTTLLSPSRLTRLQSQVRNQNLCNQKYPLAEHETSIS